MYEDSSGHYDCRIRDYSPWFKIWSEMKRGIHFPARWRAAVSHWATFEARGGPVCDISTLLERDTTTLLPRERIAYMEPPAPGSLLPSTHIIAMRSCSGLSLGRPLPYPTHLETRDVLESDLGSFEVIELDEKGVVLSVIRSCSSELEALRVVREQ